MDAEQAEPTPEPSRYHIRSSLPDRALRWTAPPARYQVTGSLCGSVFSLAYPGGGELNGNRAGVWISPEYFLSPVLDDGTPRSLQPFLQRTGSVWLNVGAGGFETRQPQAPTDRTSAFFYVGSGIDVYLTRVLALMLGGGYQRSTLQDRPSRVFSWEPGVYMYEPQEARAMVQRLREAWVDAGKVATGGDGAGLG